MPSLATGAAKAAARYTGAYAAIRRQFGMPIGRFEGVEEALARIGGVSYRMDAARRMTAGALDRGEKPSVLSAILKYQNTEGMRQVINDAMDIHGGKGVCKGPENYLATAYESLPIAITVSPGRRVADSPTREKEEAEAELERLLEIRSVARL